MYRFSALSILPYSYRFGDYRVLADEIVRVER